MPKKSAKKSGTTPSLISDSKLQQLYAMMLKCRILDSHIQSLEGKSFWKGKEAAAVGAAIDLQPEDTLIVFSGTAVGNLLRGTSLRSIFRQAHKRSSNDAKRKSKAATNTGSLVQSALATGIAYARSAGTTGTVTVAFLSESPEASEAGRNALLLAGARKLPIIYVCGGKTPDAMQLHSYDFPVIPVDGNDVVAVYRVAYECIARARKGGGPSVMMCNSSANRQNPLLNMETYLAAKDLFTQEQKQQLIKAFEKDLAQAKTAAEKRSRNSETQQQPQHIFVM
jgi:pyruvate dehydrogenase E1 component alpha subunit